jgi:dipeptidyl aminopeptidase/acylaminoacyl peptidase
VTRAKRWGLFFLGLTAGLLLAVWFSQQIFQGNKGWLAKPLLPVSQILYLKPSSAPELWLAQPDGSLAKQLTHSAGKLYDYSPWPDGSQIVYSQENSLGGLDLWMLNRDGQAAKQLLDCGADRCYQAEVSPDGQQIAFSRRNQAENPGGSAGLPRIWIYPLKTAALQPLYANALIAGSSPAWAPDGLSLAFYNPRAQAIQIYQFNSGKDILIPTQFEGIGGFLPDSLGMIYANYVQGEERPLGGLSRFDLKTGHTQAVFEELGLVDYGVPLVNSTGQWLAVAGQFQGEVSARHIWVVRLDGMEKLRISTDAQLSQAAYHWDGPGKRIIYQQLRLGSSAQAPEIYVWDLDQRTARLVVKDAFLPDWLP